MVILEKNNGKVKGRYVVDGSKQEKDGDEVSASANINRCIIYYSSVIDTSKGRCVITWDIPGAFLQAKVNPGNLIKFTDKMVNILC